MIFSEERQIYEEKNFEKSSIVDYDTLAAQDCQNDYDMLKDRPIRKEKVCEFKSLTFLYLS